MDDSSRISLWNSEGYIIEKRLIPLSEIENYKTLWLEDHDTQESKYDWSSAFCYHIPELYRVVMHEKLIDVAEQLIGHKPQPLYVQTAWRPSTHLWHEDIIRYRIAMWIALDDITINQGPLQIVPGSHSFDSTRKTHLIKTQNTTMRREKENTFIAKAGDVLFWHPKTIHRGTMMKNNTTRKAVICHYT